MALTVSVLLFLAVGVTGASAAPSLDVTLSHSPTTFPRSDRQFAYTVGVKNTASAAAAVGDPLTCSTTADQWFRSPTSFAYQWVRDGVSLGAANGAQTTVYTVQAGDAGHVLQCVVIGGNAGGASSSYTDPVAVAPVSATAPPSWAPSSSPRPGLTNPDTANPHTCTPPTTWTGSPSFTFKWLRNGVAIAGATSADYTPGVDDAGKVLQCQVTGTNAGGSAIAISLASDTPPTPSPSPPYNGNNDSRRPALSTPAATSGPVTLTVVLPIGMRAASVGRPGAPSSPPVGWTCSSQEPGGTLPGRVVCSRSDVLLPGATFPEVLVTTSIMEDPPVPTVATATAASTGAATGSAEDTLLFTDPLAFGIASFTTSVLDGAAQDLTQAGGHPFSANATFSFNSHIGIDGGRAQFEFLKDIKTDLPGGFIGNPQAAPAKCRTVDDVRSDTFLDPRCPSGSIVGVVRIDTNAGLYQRLPVYAVEPERGTPAQFAFFIKTTSVLYSLIPRLRPEDGYAISVDSSAVSKNPVVFGVSLTLCGYGTSRVLTLDPTDGGVTGCKQPGEPGANPLPFLTNPTACAATAPVTKLSIDSWDHPGVFDSTVATSPLVTGCDALPFAPTMRIEPTAKSPDKPTGLDVKMHFPQDGLLKPDGIATAHLKKAVVTLPQGMSINPGAANGLQACSDKQLGLGTNDPIGCPDASKIGSATATTPLLEETLSGAVYMRSQNSMDPESGEMFRIALVLRNDERGILVKLPGQVRADAKTGRLTATFDNNPQLPVGDITLQFKGGSTAPLATPKVCGPHTIDAALTSWGGQSVDLPSDFTIGCPPGLGWFGPYFSAGTISPVAGGSSSFVLRINKPDGQSNLNGIALSLPEGLIASLKGNVGRQIGTATVGAGPGPTPFWLSGPVVLEGPYGDAPFSLRVTVPVVAGPFNLGDVVVRQKIYVDPHDAHVTVVSDPLPTIVKGVPVRLQNLRVNIDKAGFMKNPTSCAVKSIGGTLGADTGQTAAVASRFQVGACASLPLRPKMAMELKGSKQIKRGKHPTLSTTLTQQPGESNLKSVKVRLPLSLALDPDNAEALCKPEQAAAKACPAASIVGHATAISPVLNQPLRGDVFFVEGTRQSKEGRTVKTLPKLWVALRGEVAIDVWADSSISQGKYLVTTFPFVPDAPISSFKLDINGGQHGILAVTGDVGANLCQRRLITAASYVGQNGKQVQSKVHMDSPCGFKVREKSVSISHARVTVSGIGAGKLAISGKGVHKASRTIKHSKVATLKPRLTAAGKRLYRGHKAIRLKVSFNPKAKGQKTKTTKTTVKRAKKASSTRGHRSSRTR